ncbi:MAG: hypothetical protein WBA97_13865 [Actinophytocola sp.]|uniref:hypothetical protein n=1 Tax=Actinophytocola sp. TaxID=1872138 RepID=UPI003C7165C2
MTNADELWAWVHTPLLELAAARTGDPEKSWPDLRAYLVERTGLANSADHPLVDGLLTRLDDMTDDDRVAVLDDSGKLEALAYEVVTEVAEVTGTETDTGAYDEGAWHRFVAEYGPQWTGDDESWAQFREWFLYYATESGVVAPATALVEHLDTQSAEQRIATFAEYGVQITARAGETPAADLEEKDVVTLLDQTAEFDDISEERRRELIQQIASERG